jgi:signal transduction histidine kinase
VVTLRFGDSGLELEVVDDGAPLRRNGVVPGHGLVGMRERVALLGGELETGRRASGGFRVAARLPVGGDA